MSSALLVGRTAYVAGLAAQVEPMNVTVTGSYPLLSEAAKVYYDLQPDLVLVDLGADERVGIASVARFMHTFPDAQLIGITSGFNIMTVMALESTEARGHYARCWPPAALGRIIGRVLQGKKAFATDYMEFVLG